MKENASLCYGLLAAKALTPSCLCPGKPSTGEPAAFNKSYIQTRSSSSASSSSQIRHHDPGPKYVGIEEYQRKLLDKGKSMIITDKRQH